MKKISAIILAAGSGSRMGLPYNKMFHKIDGMSIIERSIQPFINNILINEIIIVCSIKDMDKIKKLLSKYDLKYVTGANERYLSVYNGLKIVNSEYVLVHDGARCFLNRVLLDEYCNTLLEYEAALLAVVSKDTIHQMDDNGFVYNSLNRQETILAQTPQGCKTIILKKAYQALLNDNDILITDEVSLLRKYSNVAVKVVPSSYENFKITTKEDLKC